MGADRDPPALRGLPLLGQWAEYRRDPVSLIRRGLKTHGPVFTINLGPRRLVVMLGPEHHRFVLQAPPSVLSRRRSLAWMIPMFGETFPIVAEGEPYERQAGVLHAAFHESRLGGYVERVAPLVASWVKGLGSQGEFDLYEQAYGLVLSAHANLMLGEGAAARLGPGLAPLMRDLSGGTGRHLTRALSRWLPDRARDRARATLVASVQEEMRDRKAPLSPPDFLDAILAVRGKSDPPTVTDDEVAHMLVGFAWAGLDTSVGQLCWSLVQLLEHPECASRATAEVTGVIGSQGTPDLRALDALPYLRAALEESERMRPTVQVIGRTVVSDVEHAGFRLRAGWGVLLSPPVAHRLPGVFPDPDRYDPDRFRAGEARRPFSLIGFGGGARICTGKRLATLIMKTVIATLLSTHRLTLGDSNLVPTEGPHTNRPQGPIRIRFERRG